MGPEQWIAPTITGVFGVLLATVTALLARRGAKQGNREQRAPDVQELWAQQESDRRMRQLVEDLWWTVRQAFQSYYRRVNTAVHLLNLTPEQLVLFELTKKELAAIESELPAEDSPRRIPGS